MGAERVPGEVERGGVLPRAEREQVRVKVHQEGARVRALAAAGKRVKVQPAAVHGVGLVHRDLVGWKQVFLVC